MAELSEEYLLRVEQLVERIAVDVDALTQKFVDGAVEASREVKEQVDKAEKHVKKKVDDIDHYFDNLSRQGIIRWSLMGRAADKTFERWDKRQKEVFREFDRHMTKARGTIGTFGDAIGVSGAKGIMNGAMSTVKQVWGATGGSGLFGGIIGLVLFGLKKEAEWAATGTRIARQFAQVGDVSSEAVKRATKDYIKFQYAWMASEGEIAAVAQGFADFGVSAATANRQAGVEAKGFGKEVFGISMALDNLTKAGSGTFAKVIGSAMQTTGDSIRSTTRDVVLLTQELRDLGANVPKTIGQFVQMQSTMKMQRQGLDDLRRSFALLRGGLEGGPLRGMSQQHVTEMSMSGMQAAQKSVMSLSEGMAAVIGERLGGMTGIDAILAMKQGTAGKSNEHFGQVAMELGKLAKETMGGTRNEQIFGLSKMIGGDIEAARAIMTIQEEMAKNQELGLDKQAAMTKATDALNSVFAARAAETSPWEKAMLRATTHMAQIAAGALSFLGVVAAGISVLVKAAGYSVGVVSKDSFQEAARAVIAANTEFFSDRGVGKVAAGVEGLGSVAASMLKGDAALAARSPFDMTARVLRSTYGGKVKRHSSTDLPENTGVNTLLNPTAAAFDIAGAALEASGASALPAGPKAAVYQSVAKQAEKRLRAGESVSKTFEEATSAAKSAVTSRVTSTVAETVIQEPDGSETVTRTERRPGRKEPTMMGN